MRDSSDFICSAVLIILGIIGWIGYSGDLDQRLERRMEYDKRVWERTRDGNREMWEKHCLRFALGYANSIPYTVYETGEAERVYEDCVK